MFKVNRKVKVEPDIYRLKNGKYVKGYKLTAFEGITPLVIWRTTDKKQVQKFKKTWK